MIFLGGSSGGVALAVLAVVLLALFTGSPGLALILGLFVLLPVLFLRAGPRSVDGRGPHNRHGRGYPHDRVEQPQPTQIVAADVVSLRDRLAHDVRTLDPGDDPVSRQAMADASERHSTASTLLERATSPDQLRTACLAAVEGLTATRLVRQRLGLDPGPAPALPPGTGPQLTQRSRVTVDGVDHVGSPTYEPGNPHWFPGGRYGGRDVPGGWYAEPFWPDALLVGALSMWAMGGLWGPGLGGAAYGDGGWADGGDAGGGDWGGDWGGSGGGGDWGGGGGDWGGDVGAGGDFGGGGDW